MSIFRERCEVLGNKKTAPGHFIMRLGSPRIAKNAGPGQFVQILCSDSGDPLLPRPFSFLTATGKDFSVLYQVVGQGTKIMSQLEQGESLWVLGPLGNGFSPSTVHHPPSTVFLVGGGVGIPPLFHLAQHLLRSSPPPMGLGGKLQRGSKRFDSRLRGNDVHVFLGARNKSFLLCEKDFAKLGISVSVATDDGSKGRRGFVTEILRRELSAKGQAPVWESDGSTAKGQAPVLKPGLGPVPVVYACGPTPMLKAVSAICVKYRVPCEVSVEVPMACGFGACIGCAVKVNERLTYGGRHAATKNPKGMRYAMACVEGPVFRGSEILWD